MHINKVEICGVNTSKLVVLKEKEKEVLLKRAAKGDKAAREALISGNLKLVLSVVQKFATRGENLDDLFQVGCIGLIKSIDNFDTTLGVRFSTYAVPMIIGEIRRYLRDNNPIRVSRSMRDMAYKAMQAKERLLREYSREPTIQELSDALGAAREEVVLALEAIVSPLSLHDPVYADGGDTIYILDQIKDPVGDEDWLDEISFKEAVEGLTDREKRILHLRFMRGRTQMEVAEEIGISQAQVSRVEKGALARIKKQL